MKNFSHDRCVRLSMIPGMSQFFVDSCCRYVEILLFYLRITQVLFPYGSHSPMYDPLRSDICFSVGIRTGISFVVIFIPLPPYASQIHLP